jgi:hypothetical protein
MTPDDEDVEREVVQETVEETETLDQEGLSHEERREQEREALEGGEEVALAEGDWTPRSDASREEIRETVEGLDVPEPGRSFEAVPPTPEVALPPTEADVEGPGVTLSGERDDDVAPLSRADREAVASAFEGELLQAVALYDARRGRVVRAVLEREDGLEEEKAILVDGEIRDLESITDDVDAIGDDVDLADLDLEEPEEEAAPEEPGGAPEEEDAGEEAEDDGDEGGLGGRIGGLLDRGDDEDEEEGEADEPEPGEPEAETDDEGDEGGLGDRVSGLLGSDDEAEEDVDEPEAEEDVDEEPDPADVPDLDDPSEEPDVEETEADEGDEGGIADKVTGLLDRAGDEDEEEGEADETSKDADEASV